MTSKVLIATAAITLALAGLGGTALAGGDHHGDKQDKKHHSKCQKHEQSEKRDCKPKDEEEHPAPSSPPAPAPTPVPTPEPQPEPEPTPTPATTPVSAPQPAVAAVAPAQPATVPALEEFQGK